MVFSGKLAYAQELAKSGMLPKHMQSNPANLLWAIEFAQSLGIAPMLAITSVHVIEGKPSASSALIAGLVQKAHHRFRVRFDAETMTATATIHRADDPDFEFRSVWTWDRAVKAGLTGKAVWKAYAPAMLQARATTEVCRMACQDCILGLGYTPEELGAEVDAEGVVVAQTPKVNRIADRIAAAAPKALPVEAVQPIPASVPAIASDSDLMAEPEPAGWRDDKDRREFMASLNEIGVKYADLKAWRESQGRPKPSLLTRSQRIMLFDHLRGKGGVTFNGWLAERNAPLPPQDEVPTVATDYDDRGPGFHDDVAPLTFAHD